MRNPKDLLKKARTKGNQNLDQYFLMDEGVLDRLQAYAREFDCNHILEIGAGKVIPSIRIYAEQYANKGSALIRINPSKDECEEMETNIELHDKYIPLAHKSEHALKLITNALQL